VAVPGNTIGTGYYSQFWDLKLRFFVIQCKVVDRILFFIAKQS